MGGGGGTSERLQSFSDIFSLFPLFNYFMLCPFFMMDALIAFPVGRFARREENLLFKPVFVGHNREAKALVENGPTTQPQCAAKRRGECRKD